LLTEARRHVFRHANPRTVPTQTVTRRGCVIGRQAECPGLPGGLGRCQQLTVSAVTVKALTYLVCVVETSRSRLARREVVCDEAYSRQRSCKRPCRNRFRHLRTSHIVMIGRQCNGRQNADDRNDDHQFDQGKASFNRFIAISVKEGTPNPWHRGDADDSDALDMPTGPRHRRVLTQFTVHAQKRPFIGPLPNDPLFGRNRFLHCVIHVSPRAT